jgi:hypothetical protein
MGKDTKATIVPAKRSKAEAEKANMEARANSKKARFYLPSRVDQAGHGPRTSEDPFEGPPREVNYPRILREGKAFRIRGEAWLGDLPGDRGIMIKLVMNGGQVRHDREELIAKGFFTEAEMEAMENGEHPDQHKDGPNEMPEMRIGDIDHLTDFEASAYCEKHNILVPAGADVVVKREYIKKRLAGSR